MQVLKMAMNATVEMLMINSFQPTLESVTFHALAIKINSVAARGVYKYMIPEMLTIPNIHMLQPKVQRHGLSRKQLCHQQTQVAF